MSNLERRSIPRVSLPKTGPDSVRLKPKHSGNKANPRHMKITIERDEYGIFWNVTFETPNFIGTAAFDYPPGDDDPELKGMESELIRLESRVR